MSRGEKQTNKQTINTQVLFRERHYSVVHYYLSKIKMNLFYILLFVITISCFSFLALLKINHWIAELELLNEILTLILLDYNLIAAKNQM